MSPSKQKIKGTLVVSPQEPNEADLYIPLKQWQELTRKLHGNRLTVVLRIQGE